MGECLDEIHGGEVALEGDALDGAGERVAREGALESADRHDHLLVDKEAERMSCKCGHLGQMGLEEMGGAELDGHAVAGEELEDSGLALGGEAAAETHGAVLESSGDLGALFGSCIACDIHVVDLEVVECSREVAEVVLGDVLAIDTESAHAIVAVGHGELCVLEEGDGIVLWVRAVDDDAAVLEHGAGLEVALDGAEGSLDNLSRLEIGAVGLRADHELHVDDAVLVALLEDVLDAEIDVLCGLEQRADHLALERGVEGLAPEELLERVEGLDLGAFEQLGAALRGELLDARPSELGGERAVEAAVEVGLWQAADEIVGDLWALDALPVASLRGDCGMEIAEGERVLELDDDWLDVVSGLDKDAERGVERVSAQPLAVAVAEECRGEAVVEELEDFPGLEVELFLDEVVLRGQGDVGDDAVVCAWHCSDSRVEELAQRMLGEGVDGLGLHVGGDAHFDGDGLVDDELQQALVGAQCDSVADAASAAVADRVPHALPACGLFFARVQGAVEIVSASNVERALVELA
eukprot:comp22270_c0_seq1/m.53074 comp22270_c0_seq1/g.53074  ORF comp22270_c0_seq1/g.53074 comp22270_c0_seq1/m.53074 type:complete len:526 (+) comp22270_c0_seq1:255-1832(+)